MVYRQQRLFALVRLKGWLQIGFTTVFLSFLLFNPAQAQTKKPNILTIWGDDIGFTNVSTYSRGVMGYRTPKIEHVTNEGISHDQ